MSFDSLPNDVLLHIVCQARAGDETDLCILRAVPLISIRFSRLMYTYRTHIIDYYSMTETCDMFIRHTFCGLTHRFDDKPALILNIANNNVTAWHYYQWGKRHRDNDQPAVICANGSQEWRQHGYLHRDNDQPAIIYAGISQLWYRHGERHRDNGLPAVIHADGVVEYWINDTKISKPHLVFSPKLNSL